jgi:hypothetical protein
MTSSSTPRPSVSTPANDLPESVRQTVTDLMEVCQRLPMDSAEAEPVAKIMDRLSEECAEAAAMLRALPDRPADRPGYTFAAAAAVTRAAEGEHDFGRWLAAILCQAAAHLGSSAALVAGRSGGWEAEAVLALVQGTAGFRDEHLSAWEGRRTAVSGGGTSVAELALVEQRWQGSGWRFAWHESATGDTFIATRAGLRITASTAAALETELARWARS